MQKISRILVVATLMIGSLSIAGAAHGGLNGLGGPTNDQDGDNSSETEQSGSSSSGDAVGGQVVGVVSSGDASVDSTNRSEDVDIETGDAQATNNVDNFTGQRAVVGFEVEGSNEQEGDNSAEVNQLATATSGDGVGGSVIGVVTSTGGSADVVAANTSEDVDIDTGDASADNDLIEAFTGQSYFNDCDIVCSVGSNEQEGNNELEAAQSATSASGDGVGGQVLGIVSAGDASIDATNSSTDVDVETGDADADNEAGPVTGQDYFVMLGLGLGENELEGGNSTDLNQTATATSGDGVGGQVAGVVNSAGGSADVVAANTSEDVDVETGDGSARNFANDVFVGQSYINLGGRGGYNYQTGDNELSADQSARAASGDGVGGQVLGIVSAGDASVDATNSSADVDVETGNADADNFAESFVGQSYFNPGLLNGGGDNDLEGDISGDLVQDATAVSGDAVAGQVAGVVTSAGGSADLVLANTSDGVDAETGESEFDNEDDSFVGQEIFASGMIIVNP